MPLGLPGNLAYIPGPDYSLNDEAIQTLAYKIAAIPSFMKLFKADGTTAVNVNGAVTLAELTGLKFKTVPNLFGTTMITVRATGSGGGDIPDFVEVTLRLDVTPVNDAPRVTAAVLDDLSEITTNDAVVGTFTAVDPEGGQISSFAIAGGNTGNAFKIDTTSSRPSSRARTCSSVSGFPSMAVEA